jgi:hypothetical protein
MMEAGIRKLRGFPIGSPLYFGKDRAKHIPPNFMETKKRKKLNVYA